MDISADLAGLVAADRSAAKRALGHSRLSTTGISAVLDDDLRVKVERSGV